MQNQSLDESRFAMLLHFLDLSLDALDAESLGKTPQEF
jgi:hypothetical protein